MATYIYETIPEEKGALPERFEIQQSMTEEALTKHPNTGEPIKRIITGGFGYFKKNVGECIGSVDDYAHGHGHDHEH
jgi:predicted nucleic acid-binding Zn ribbon protein